MTKSIGWELYRSFLAALTEGSLFGAARALGLTQPTVGRHVAALEAAFGQTLFTPSQTGLLATEAALSLGGHAQAMQRSAAALGRAPPARARASQARSGFLPAKSSRSMCGRRRWRS